MVGREAIRTSAKAIGWNQTIDQNWIFEDRIVISKRRNYVLNATDKYSRFPSAMVTTKTRQSKFISI